MKVIRVLGDIVNFYRDGFANMREGRVLWIVILVKLFIIFVVLKLFFFSDFISSQAPPGTEADFVAGEVMKRQ